MNAPRTPGRPISPARTAARSSGAAVYQGRPCKRGHGGARYTSTAACVDCTAGRPARPGPGAAAIALALI